MRDGADDAAAIVGVSYELTELRLTHHDAFEMSQDFRLALEATGMGTWRWDWSTGHVEWDVAMERNFGLAPGTFEGTFAHWARMVVDDDLEEVLRTLQEAVEHGRYDKLCYRVRWPDGSVHWLEAVAATADGEPGAPFIGCALDVTDRVEAELVARRAMDAAIRAAAGERHQRELLEFLAHINVVLNESADRREIMQRVTREAVPRLGDWCAIYVVTEGAGRPDVEVAHVDPTLLALARNLHEHSHYDPDAPTGIPYVIRTGKPVVYSHITDEILSRLDAGEEAVSTVRRLGLRSSIAVPLVKRGRVLGAMLFAISSGERRYEEDDLSLALALAGRVASSLENRRLADEQRLIAQTLQRSLLPDQPPEIDGVDVAVRYWAAGESTEVGGDFSTSSVWTKDLRLSSETSAVTAPRRPLSQRSLDTTSGQTPGAGMARLKSLADSTRLCCGLTLTGSARSPARYCSRVRPA